MINMQREMRPYISPVARRAEAELTRHLLFGAGRTLAI
jgi:hypothetical protein